MLVWRDEILYGFSENEAKTDCSLATVLSSCWVCNLPATFGPRGVCRRDPSSKPNDGRANANEAVPLSARLAGGAQIRAPPSALRERVGHIHHNGQGKMQLSLAGRDAYNTRRDEIHVCDGRVSSIDQQLPRTSPSFQMMLYPSIQCARGSPHYHHL